MSPLTCDELHEMFHGLDHDCDGMVSLEALHRQLLESSGVSITKDELTSLIGKSSLNLEEFTLLYNSIEIQNDVVVMGFEEDDGGLEDSPDHQEEKEEEDCLKKAFQVFDVDGDGFISCEELEDVLRRLGLWDEKSGKDPAAMICKFDKNLDGLLDFDEFRTMVM